MSQPGAPVCAALGGRRALALGRLPPTSAAASLALATPESALSRWQPEARAPRLGTASSPCSWALHPRV